MKIFSFAVLFSLLSPPTFAAPRIAEPAPDFELEAPGLGKWSLAAKRGKSALLFVLAAPGLEIRSRKQPPTEALLAMMNAAEELRKNNVETVLAAPGIGVDLGALNADGRLTGLRDENNLLIQLFAINPKAIALVAVDRAGFLRRVETVRDLADVALLLRRLGDSTPPLTIGKPAPDFALPDAHGQVRRLSDYRGGNVLLTFFPKCPIGCPTQLPGLRDTSTDLTATTTQVLAISTDPAHFVDPQIRQDVGLAAYGEAERLEFPLLSDIGRNVCLLYGTVVKTDERPKFITMLIDKSGVLRAVMKDFEKRLDEHAADCLKKLRELGME